MPTTSRIREQAIDRFWETVPPLWGSIRAHLRAQATAHFDVTVEQFQVLRYARRHSKSMSELAAAKRISRPAVSQAVEVLVKKGLLTRVEREQDRRYVGLALTKAGNELLDEVFNETRAWMRERMKVLDEDELEAVVKAMPALRKMAEQFKPRVSQAQ
jgi:DNA-binding MarR family transcriptional regulator